jgi:hypothetical protein
MQQRANALPQPSESFPTTHSRLAVPPSVPTTSTVVFGLQINRKMSNAELAGSDSMAIHQGSLETRLAGHANDAWVVERRHCDIATDHHRPRYPTKLQHIASSSSPAHHEPRQPPRTAIRWFGYLAFAMYLKLCIFTIHDKTQSTQSTTTNASSHGLPVTQVSSLGTPVFLYTLYITSTALNCSALEGQVYQ